MPSLLQFSLVVLAAVGGSEGQEGCNMSYVIGIDCCKYGNLAPTSITAHVEVCYQKYVDNPPSTPAEVRDAQICTTECIFSMEGLLNADNKLDEAAIIEHFSFNHTELRPLMTSAADRCWETYEADIDSTQECKSGATEFTICFKRAIFLDCPSSLWNPSPECEELKATSVRCPKVLVLLHIPEEVNV